MEKKKTTMYHALIGSQPSASIARQMWGKWLLIWRSLGSNEKWLRQGYVSFSENFKGLQILKRASTLAWIDENWWRSSENKYRRGEGLAPRPPMLYSRTSEIPKCMDAPLPDIRWHSTYFAYMGFTLGIWKTDSTGRLISYRTVKELVG